MKVEAIEAAATKRRAIRVLLTLCYTYGQRQIKEDEPKAVNEGQGMVIPARCACRTPGAGT
jgi:hypothetical protein